MSHRFISATFQLYIEENGQEVLKQQFTEDQPLSVYTEIGMLLPSFETRLAEFVTGVDYDFVLPQAEAYGEYDPKGRATLPKKMFSPDGVFDEANVFAGAVIPLADENGQRYLGYVVSVDDDTVTVDMNHPLAGKDLHFKGHIIENRPATEEEVNDFVEKSKQHQCSGHCGDCGGGCGDGGDCHCDGDGEGGCHCGDGEGGGCGCH